MNSVGRGAFLVIALFALVLPSITSAQDAVPKPSTSVYELRIYTTNEGKMPDLHARFRNHSIRILAKHGMESLYYWTVMEGAQGDDVPNTLVYLLQHKSRAAADASWEAFRADPEWQEVSKKSEENGKLLSRVPVSIFMTPTDFSPAIEPTGAQAPARLFELRQYNVGESGLPGTVDRFKAGEAALFPKHSMPTLGFWTALDNSAFIYLLSHKDRETAKESWQGFFAEFRQFTTEYNARRGAVPAVARGAATRGARDGGGNQIRYLVPTDYSPRR